MTHRWQFLVYVGIAALFAQSCGELPADDEPAGTATGVFDDAYVSTGVGIDFQGGAFEGVPQQAPLPELGADRNAVDLLRGPACPAGQIRWTFEGATSSAWISELSRIRGDEVHEESYERPAQSVTLLDVACGVTEATRDAELIRSQCEGRERCLAPVACRGEMEVSYRCGGPESETRVARPRTLDSGLRLVELTCGFTSVRPPVGTRTVCIPKLCRGQMRRNADLQCVPDFTMPVYDARKEVQDGPTFLSFQAPIPPVTLVQRLRTEGVRRWQLQNQGDISALYAREGAQELLFEGGLYDIRTAIQPSNAAQKAALETPDLRATLWFSDIYRTPNGTVEVFRCVGHTFEVEEEGPVMVMRALNTQVAAGCFGERAQRASFRDAYRRALGRDLPENDIRSDAVDGITFLHSTAHLSLDLEGRILVVTDPFDEATACAPNPQEMFYDRATDRYDQLTYHRQRLVHTYTIPSSTAPRRFVLTHAPQVTLGVNHAELRDPVITAYQFTRLPVYMSLDVNWFTAFESLQHPYSTESYLRDQGQTNLPNTALRDVQLQAFLYEHAPLEGGLSATALDATAFHGMPLLGRRRVGGAEPTGSTVSLDLTLTPEYQALFFDPQSRYYIPMGSESRRFEVLVCLVTGTDSRTSPRPYVVKPFNWSWATIFLPADRARHPSTDVAYTVTLNPPLPGVRDPWAGTTVSSTLHVRLWDLMVFGHTRRNTPVGCVFADRPLFVEPDRYVRAVEPVTDRTWRGQVGEQLSGDATVEGESGDQMGQTCERLPGALADTCTSAIGNDGRSGGSEFSDPLSEFDGFMRTIEGGIARAEGLMSLFGFLVMDTQGVEIDLDALEDGDDDAADADDEGGPPIYFSLEYDDGSLELSIFPPFDRAADALNSAMQDDRVKWEGDDEGELALVFTKEKNVKIGPIPGTIVVTLSSGVTVRLWFNYRWRRATGEEYACLGSEDACYVLFDGENMATFEDAVATCAEGAGRLAAPTSAEAVARINELRRTTFFRSVWVGGQLGTRFEDISCLGLPPILCRKPWFTTVRWVQGDGVYRGEDGAVVTPAFHAGGYIRDPMSSWFEGIAMIPGERLVNQDTRSRFPFVCQYEPATATQFRQVSAGLDTSVFASLGLGFCSPNAKAGICINGSLKFIEVTLEPQFSKSDWTIVGLPGTGTRKISNFDVDVTLGITLLAAEINATLRAWIFKRTWNLLRYPGLKVLDQTLYAYSLTSEEVLP